MLFLACQIYMSKSTKTKVSSNLKIFDCPTHWMKYLLECLIKWSVYNGLIDRMFFVISLDCNGDISMRF